VKSAYSELILLNRNIIFTDLAGFIHQLWLTRDTISSWQSLPPMLLGECCSLFFLFLFWRVCYHRSNRHAAVKQRNLRSKIWWFTDVCNSHYVSHLAAFFIVQRAKISIVESCAYVFLQYLYGYTVYFILFKSFRILG